MAEIFTLRRSVRAEMKSREYRGSEPFCRYLWLMTGIIGSIAVACMVLCGSFNINKFYDAGEVCDFSEGRIYSAWRDCERTAEGTVTVTEIPARLVLALHQIEDSWKYIMLGIGETDQEQLSGIWNIYNSAGARMQSGDFTLTEGNNCIEIMPEVPFVMAEFIFSEEVGTAIRVESAQLRMEPPQLDGWKLPGMSVLIFFIYAVLSLGIRYMVRGKPKTDMYGFITFLQKIYVILGNGCGKRFTGNPEKVRSGIRAALFCFLLLYMQAAKNLNWYENAAYYKYQIVIAGACILFIALLSREGNLHAVNWRNPLTASWMLFWTIVCVSDFVVPKFYAWVGYAMFFSVGIFVFVWNNMKNPYLLVEEFMLGVKWSFFFNLIFCLFCRPEIEGTRYMGGYFNPITFAMYLVFVWIVLLQSIAGRIRREEQWVRYVPDFVMGGAVLTFLWKGQCTTGVIPAVLATILFAVDQRILCRTKIRAAFVALAVASAVLMILFVDWGINTLPDKCGTTIEFEYDVYEIRTEKSLGAETVYAGQKTGILESSRIYRKLFSSTSLESFTSGRNLFWMAYLRELNLFGNAGKTIRMWGESARPHNGFIEIAYRYGVIALIPYISMVFINFWYSWKRFREKKPYGYLLFAGSVCFLILLSVDNIERSFQQLGWLFFYLMMGINFVREGDLHEKA